MAFVGRIAETDFFGDTFMKRALEFNGVSWKEIRKSFEEVDCHEQKVDGIRS